MMRLGIASTRRAPKQQLQVGTAAANHRARCHRFNSNRSSDGACGDAPLTRRRRILAGDRHSNEKVRLSRVGQSFQRRASPQEVSILIDQRADPAPEARRVHLYCRVSTAEQSREGYSLGEQERQCRAIAETYYSDREIVLWVELVYPLECRSLSAKRAARWSPPYAAAMF
jgi:hypothetical protein